MGLPRVYPVFPPWTKSEIALVGKLPDKEVARRTGRTLYAVQTRRNRLKLPNALGARIKWLPGEVRLLGTAPDKEIARRLGRPVLSVKRKRLALGVAAKRKSRLV
jgi:hypothetical protein